MQTVSLLGLGIMGSVMPQNLLKAGFPLTVYNRTPAKASALAQQDVRVAETPKAAATNAQIMIGMVGDDAALQAIWLGEDGALAGAQQGAILVECSTLSLGWVRELAGLATAKKAA
jgi:3-hydroxyisobutyrate dehydrogenase